MEKQVGTVRQRFFAPRLRFKSYTALNAQPHPEQTERTVFEVFEAERPALIPYRGPFDGFRVSTVAVSKTCLVRFDGNKYSVLAQAVGRPATARWSRCWPRC